METQKAFDYKWKHFAYPQTDYAEDRIRELLEYTQLPADFFNGKLCLDVGCGNGRFTWAMQELGARVVSFDDSLEAVMRCSRINPEAYTLDLMNLKPNPVYDFVLCYGVLHHLKKPNEGFKKVASQVKKNGYLLIMVYHKDLQKQYVIPRFISKLLPLRAKLAFAQWLANRSGGNIQGWFDALNPRYNHAFTEHEVLEWFSNEGFTQAVMTRKYNVTVIGRK